jgi:hypothetical protein
MPLIPIDYTKIIIYKLVNKEDYDNANIYIGSTTDFRRRKNQHKQYCNNQKNIAYNTKKYQYIRENGGWDIWNMIEIEKYPCNDKREAEAREEYWRCYYNSNLNSQMAFRTKENEDIYKKIWYENNKEDILKKQKNQYENNKETILNKSKEKIICECGCILSKGAMRLHYKSQKHINASRH